MRVLIADDEPLQCATLSTLCERAGGCSLVAQAGTGRDAVALAGRLLPDLVLLDVKMPDMDGLEAAERIRHLLPRTTVVFVSAYAEFAFAQRAVALGARRYLLKPVDPSEVAALIKEIQPSTIDIPAQYAGRIQTFLAAHLSKPLTLKDVARAVRLSPTYASRVYKTLTGETIWTTLTRLRLERAYTLLRETGYPVAEVARACGFADQGYFTRLFRHRYGFSPSSLRSSWRRSN